MFLRKKELEQIFPNDALRGGYLKDQIQFAKIQPLLESNKYADELETECDQFSTIKFVCWYY